MKRNIGDLIYELGDNGDIYESKVFRTYTDDYGRTVYDTIDPISGMPGVAFDERAVGGAIFDSFSEAKDKAIERYGRYTTYEIRKQAKLKVIEALLKEAIA